MNKRSISFSFVIIMIFLAIFVKAEDLVDVYDDNEGIYFCTKDLDVLNSVTTKVPENNNTDKGRYCAANKLDSELLTDFRHCFLMIAKKIKGNDSFYYLESDQAPFGYGSEDSGLSSSGGSENSLNSPPSKQGKARAEMIATGTAIACVPMLGQDDIKNKAVDGKVKSMFYWWTAIQNIMHESANKKLYNTFSHNCCTVASEAIGKVGGHLENINFLSFNEGYGTMDRKEISLLEFLGLATKLSSEVSSASSGKIFNFLFKIDSSKGSEICHDKHNDTKKIMFMIMKNYSSMKGSVTNFSTIQFF